MSYIRLKKVKETTFSFFNLVISFFYMIPICFVSQAQARIFVYQTVDRKTECWNIFPSRLKSKVKKEILASAIKLDFRSFQLTFVTLFFAFFKKGFSSLNSFDRVKIVRSYW